ncbi:hypothetical protein [Modestobacter versicolor]|uniref:hypothetical protein n=1 Tax=Modestobacter versicolor TaxID=429133 RepID=UPI0034DEB6A8
MTTTWEVVHRPADGERVGYLAPAPAGDGLVVPMTLAGTVVGGALAAEEATALLSARGLALLDGRWWCRLPSPLPRGLTDARDPAPDWPWQPTVLVEVSPTQLTLRPEWPAPGEAGALAVLPVPAGDLLRSEAP